MIQNYLQKFITHSLSISGNPNEEQATVCQVMSKSPERILIEFNALDIFGFQWKILRYMCEMCPEYKTFEEKEPFNRAELSLKILSLT